MKIPNKNEDKVVHDLAEAAPERKPYKRTTKAVYKKRVERIGAIRHYKHIQAFLTGIQSLQRYMAKDAKNTANVPVTHVDKEDGYPLGRWVAAQRTRYRKGKLDQSEIDLLNLFEGWQWKAWDGVWDKGLALVEQFRAREGHVRVPLSHVEDDFRLGAWCARQRHKLNQTDPAKAHAKAHLLAHLPEWKENWLLSESEIVWDKYYEAMRQYAAKKGNAKVRRAYCDNGMMLGIWANRMRSQYNKGTLSDERRLKLEEIEGWEWAKPRPSNKP